jgi:hypothetical protein
MNSSNYMVITFCLLLLFLFALNKTIIIREEFANYLKNPFSFVDTGSTPLNFYRKCEYRKPYKYPYTYNKSYPIPNVSHYPIL